MTKRARAPRAHARARGAATGRAVRGFSVGPVVAAVAIALGTDGCAGGVRTGSGAHANTRARHAAATRAGTAADDAFARAQAVGDASVKSRGLTRAIALGLPLYCAPRRGDEVALTFDDGPGPYTRLVLAKLRKHAIAATFFVVARNIALVHGALRSERALGAVGDHTFTHPLLTALAPQAARTEITRAQRAIAAASGGVVRLFRPPYGAHDARIDAAVRAHGMLEVMWSVDSADSRGANYAQIERNVIGGLRPGAIILMHENHGQTVRALLAIFAALQRRHLRAVSLPTLLANDPLTAAQLRAGRSTCAHDARPVSAGAG